MSSINCSSCGKRIPADATTCPNCQTAIASKAVRLAATPPRGPRRILSRKRLLSIAVLIGIEFLVFWYWKSRNPDQPMTETSGVAAPNAPAQRIVREFSRLKESQSATYAFTLSENAKVRVEVSATPEPVDVMLMTGDEAAKFEAAQGKLFALSYTYRKSMSAQEVRAMDKIDILPPGNWAVVVVRPHEDVFFKKDTAATTVLTIY